MYKDIEILDVIFLEDFAQYRLGFVDGQNDLLNLMLNGIDYYEEIDDNNSFMYDLGYDDAYMYYQKLFLEKGRVSLDELLGERAFIVLSEFFFQRIGEYNKNNNSRFPAVTLKLLLSRGKNDEKM